MFTFLNVIYSDETSETLPNESNGDAHKPKDLNESFSDAESASENEDLSADEDVTDTEDSRSNLSALTRDTSELQSPNRCAVFLKNLGSILAVLALLLRTILCILPCSTR